MPTEKGPQSVWSRATCESNEWNQRPYLCQPVTVSSTDATDLCDEALGCCSPELESVDDLEPLRQHGGVEEKTVRSKSS